MKAVKEKIDELQQLKQQFVSKATTFLLQLFSKIAVSYGGVLQASFHFSKVPIPFVLNNNK